MGTSQNLKAGVAHGRVEIVEYDSTATGARRKAAVYLPAGYSAEHTYPVLYLLHDIAGNHDEWRGFIHADTIVDNVIAEGKAVPMIVVMPNGRALHDDSPPPPEKMFTPEVVAGFANFERDLLECLIRAIQAKYSTATDREHRAIAGLSMADSPVPTPALNVGANLFAIQDLRRNAGLVRRFAISWRTTADTAGSFCQ